MDKLSPDLICHIGTFLKDDALSLMACRNACKLFDTIGHSVTHKKIIFRRHIVQLDETIQAIRKLMPNLVCLCIKLVSIQIDALEPIYTNVFDDVSFSLKIKINNCSEIDSILFKLRSLPISQLHIHLKRSYNYHPIEHTNFIHKLKIYRRHLDMFKYMPSVKIEHLIIRLGTIDLEEHDMIELDHINSDNIHLDIESFYFSCTAVHKITSLTLSYGMIYSEGTFIECLKHSEHGINIKDVYVYDFCPKNFSTEYNPVLFLMSLLPKGRVTYHILVENDSYIIPFLARCKEIGIKSKDIKFWVMSHFCYNEARLLQLLNPEEQYGLSSHGKFVIPHPIPLHQTVQEAYTKLTKNQKLVYFWVASSHITLPSDSQAV